MMQNFTHWVTVISSALLFSTATAFAPTVLEKTNQPCIFPTSLFATTSDSSRRELLGATLVSFVTVVTTTTTVPRSAKAEPRPMYLTEPTEEFKANEAKAMEFKRQQLLIKKEFATVLEQFLAEPNDSLALEKDLRSLKALVAKTGGLPLGVKKDELFKAIRSKKAKGFWPTPVEIAYQSLIQEISFQQSPNLDKEMGNPFQ